jgi:hypothetical protein
MVADSSQSTKIVRIQSMFPATLKYTGHISGKQYVWDGAGRMVDVNEEDVPYLLSKRIGRGSCCGVRNEDGNVLFQLYNKEAVNA